MEVKEDFKDQLLNLYSTVEFLKKELEERNYVIRSLLQQPKHENLEKVNLNAHVETRSLYQDCSDNIISGNNNYNIPTKLNKNAENKKDINGDKITHKSINGASI